MNIHVKEITTNAIQVFGRIHKEVCNQHIPREKKHKQGARSRIFQVVRTQPSYRNEQNAQKKTTHSVRKKQELQDLPTDLNYSCRTQQDVIILLHDRSSLRTSEAVA